MSGRAIPIRSSGSEPALFMPHQESDEPIYALMLAPHIDAEIPVYALPPTPAEAIQLRTVEAMAARMVRMIHAVQPVGPYRIAGWGVAGTLAYEIAMQLIGEDETVQFLGLLDTDLTNAPEFIPEDPKDQLVRYCELITATSKAGKEDPALGELRLIAAVTDFETLLRKCSEALMLPPFVVDLTSAEVRQFLDRFYTIRMAAVQYIPQRIPIPVRLFIAEDDKAGTDLLQGWSSFLPENQFQVHRAGGTHRGMLMSPNVEGLGWNLSQAIRSAPAEIVASPERNYSALVTLHASRHNKNIAPLFCVPGAGASVTCFLELAGSLDVAWPIYGLQPRGLDDILVPHSTVVAAAECYLRAVRAIHPKGAVHLLGHSLGGWVVFEIAQRLMKAGSEVASLTILDSEPPDDDDTFVGEYNSTEAIMFWIEIFEQIAERSLGINQSDLDSRSEAAQREILHGCLVREGLLPRRSQPDVLRGPLRTFATSLRTRFKPGKPYPGPVQLVLACDPKLDRDANRRKHEYMVKRWKKWAPNLACTQATGNHMTVLKPPHMFVLARLISDSGKETIVQGKSVLHT